MESKKSKKANLENKKGIFMMIGMIISLGIVIMAFEWKTPDLSLRDKDHAGLMNWDEDIVPITEHKKPEVKIEKPKTLITINIVDKKDLIEDFYVIDVEADIHTEVEPYVFKMADETSVVDDTPFKVVEQMPEFPGGIEALYKFIGKHIVYPQLAKETGVVGTVYLGFIIETDGSVSNIEVLRTPHPDLSTEAIRVLKLLPNWIPGKQRNKTVRVEYTLPFKFSLQ